jgi:hypothetical protein
VVSSTASPARAALVVPEYNSLPDAHAQLYLDFGGTTFQGTWAGRTPGTIPAYDTNDDPGSFSVAELRNIREIFLRVAEKYSPFNINVTTVDPGNRNNKETAHLIIGGDGAWYSTQPVGGVALRSGFTSSSSNTAWVFPDHLSGGNPKTVAEASAHEAGHLFGLGHQSTFVQQTDGTWNETQEYSTNGNDLYRRPIMGSSYSSARGLWWLGQSVQPPASPQDDLSILSNATNGFGYRADDHGNTVASATALTTDITGRVVSTGGIISTITDADLFSFTTGAPGPASFWLSLAEFGTMLDATLRLFTADGTLLETADTNNLPEAMSRSLLPGDYLLGVYGRGNYGDLGQYTLHGQLTPVLVPEPTLACALLACLYPLVTCRRRRA